MFLDSLKEKIIRATESLNSSGKYQTRTYILPTLFGLAFAAFSFLLLLIALAYNNNLTYLFVFLTISLALIGMIQTNKNIEQVRVSGINFSPGFATDLIPINIILQNISHRTAWQVAVENQVIDIPAKNSVSTIVYFSANTRGWHSLPRYKVASDFPFSMLRAWKNTKSIDARILIFPRRSGQTAFPEASGEHSRADESGLFRGLREFQNRDSIRRVDWRSTSRLQKLMVRHFEDNQPAIRYLFSWDQLHHLGHSAEAIETRLCQLALWVDRAEAMGHTYGLKIPGFDSEFSHGPAHKSICLEKLALYHHDEIL